MRYLAWTMLAMSCLIAGCGGGRGDTAPPPAVQVNSSVTPNEFLTFIDTTPQIDSDAYANAYYSAVDPANERTTLADWKAVNNFDQGVEAHATFRDAKDLGYGRDMYARHRTDGSIAIYVDNYVVQIEPGDATTYGPLNLDAAINREQKYHIGTNAIEFSPDPLDAAHKIAKFFTFGPPDANGVQQRLIAADLDGRGIKHMPNTCVVCHGGTMYPLQVDGSFEPISKKSPKPHVIEENSVEFSALAGFTEADQRDAVKAINAMVLETFTTMGLHTDVAGDQANWDGSFAQELLEGAYGGTGLPSAYQADFIPAGWKQTPTRPDGVETLYQQVIEPHCIGCHSLRGTQVAKANTSATQFPNTTNFSSYEEFIASKDLIIDYVYRRGAMPRSLVNFSQFWKNPDGAPTLLATYLSGFDVFDSYGKVVMPGKAVAIPGTNRSVRSPVTLDASASKFTSSYGWSIVSKPATANASLSSATSAAPVFTADVDGTYILELVTSNVLGLSDPVQVTITIDSTLTPSQTDLTFVQDIMSPDGVAGVFGSSGGGCVSCHASGVTPGIPVYYDVGNYLGHEKDLYRNVLNRVNLGDPENSLLLRKPAGLRHGGGMVLDRSIPAGEALYNKLLNWIRNGAPCGSDATYCN